MHTFWLFYIYWGVPFCMQPDAMTDAKRIKFKIKDLGTTYIPLNDAKMPEFVRLRKRPPRDPEDL